MFAANLKVDLPSLLTWRDFDAVQSAAALAVCKHQTFVAQRLAAAFDASSGLLSDRAGLRDQLVELPESALLRILRAPETCHSLYRLTSADKGAMIQFLTDSIAAEKALLGERPRTDRALWTALGDWYIPADSQADPEPMSAAILAGRIVVDLDSPFANTAVLASNFRPPFGSAEPFTDEERRLVLSRIRIAAEAIEACDSVAHAFYSQIVQTVMARVDRLNPTFKGSSNRGIIGRVNLYNPQLSYIDYGAVSASLIHESIHNFLYVIEQDGPLFDNEDFAHNVFLRSSFSGKRVHLLAYVHAVFVWYALLHFWRAPAVRNYFPQRSVNYFIRFCSSGFSDRQVEQLISPFREHIHPGIVDQLMAMQDAIDRLEVA